MADNQPGVHEISDRFVSDYVALHPIVATYLGIPNHDDKLTDFTPDGHAARAELARAALADIQAVGPSDPAAEVARAVFVERIGLALEIHDAKLDVSALNTIDSPVQDVRQVFDLMSTETSDDWATIATRLAAVPDALRGVRASLDYSAGHGRPAAL